MDQRFNLDAWKALCTVENTGSLSEAAIELGTDVSTVSRLIAHLEKALGRELIRRTERPAVMTEEGRQIARNVAPVLKAHAAFLAQIASDIGTMTGTIRLSITEDLIPDNLMSILTDFQATYPGINFQIFEGNTIEECLRGSVDIAVTSQKRTEKEIHCLAQGISVFVPVASPAYLRKKPEPSNPENLANHTGFVYRNLSAISTEHLHLKGLVRDVRYKNIIETDDLRMIKKGVLDGRGITTSLPLSYCAKEIASGRLRVVLNGWHHPPIPSYSLCSTAGWNTRRIRVFMQWWCKRLIEEFEASEESARPVLGSRMAVYTDI